MLEDHFKKIIMSTGENLQRDGLIDSPKRAAAAFEFLTRGYQESLEKIVDGALFSAEYDDMVILKDLDLYSLCEHHLLPFFGKCHIGYLPNQKIIGISRIARLVDIFAHRLQVQEKLTQQIAEALYEITQCRGVGVIIEAQHLCMIMPGIGQHHSAMKTSAMLGAFREDQSTRSEFLSLVSKV